MAHDLRAYVFLDSLQSQLAAHTATRTKGYMPVSGQASLWIEVALFFGAPYLVRAALGA